MTMRDNNADDYPRAQLAAFTRAPERGAADSSAGPVGGAQKEADEVNRPAHYTASKIECIDAIDCAISGLDGREAFYSGQVLKYMWRWKLKGGVKDLKKAKWYLERLIGVAK